jgi:hypothetical protein
MASSFIYLSRKAVCNFSTLNSTVTVSDEAIFVAVKLKLYSIDKYPHQSGANH